MRALILATFTLLPAGAQETAGGTARLGSPLRVPQEQANGSVLDVLNGVPDTMEPLTHEGTGKALEELKKTYDQKANLSNTAAKRASGASGAGKRAQAVEWKGAQAKKAGFIDRAGKFLNKLDLLGKIAQGFGRAWEGDYIGVGELAVDEATKKLMAAAGAAGLGALGGPLGAVVGAGAGEEVHKRTTGKAIAQGADAWRTQRLKDEKLGMAWSGRYSGTVTWTQTVADPNGMAPPMTFHFSGPMTADLDAKTGALRIEYSLKGSAPNLVGGATVGISMNLSMTSSGALTGRAEGGSFSAEGAATSVSHFRADFGGLEGAPPPQEQTQRGSATVRASGTYTRETLTGTLTTPGSQARPLNFTLSKER